MGLKERCLYVKLKGDGREIADLTFQSICYARRQQPLVQLAIVLTMTLHGMPAFNDDFL